MEAVQITGYLDITGGGVETWKERLWKRMISCRYNIDSIAHSKVLSFFELRRLVEARRRCARPMKGQECLFQHVDVSIGHDPGASLMD